MAIDLMEGVHSDSRNDLVLREYQLRIDAINERYGLGLYYDEDDIDVEADGEPLKGVL